MTARRCISILLLVVCPLLLGSCGSFQTKDPLQVTVAGIEPLQGQGLELRLMVKLRVQNPNDAPIEYNGVAVEMNVQGDAFATGVADVTGTVPRFGETVIDVPVTISALRMVRQAVGLVRGGATVNKIEYEMKGKLAGTGIGATRFSTSGAFDMPASAGAAQSP